ncbi:MAG: DUF192 domain-containing protein [Patescibacteria group bacterium]
MSAPKHILALGFLVLAVLTFSRNAESFVNTIKGNLSPYQTSATLGRTHLWLEVVTKTTDQERGLSGRDILPAEAGMLFVFNRPTVPAFWMKEMSFPLDLIWLDANRRVVSISPNLGPETYPQTFSPGQKIQYVLELNAGSVAKNHFAIGDKLRY